jgi:hypothetical protein
LTFNGYGADGTTNAAIYNNSGGSVTINAQDCSNLTVRNGTGASTTVNQSVTLTITVQDVNKDPIQNAQTSIYLLDSPYTQLMNEDTTSLGVATETYNYTSDIDIKWRVRKSETTDDPRYFAASGTGKVTASGFTLLVTLEVNPFI